MSQSFQNYFIGVFIVLYLGGGTVILRRFRAKQLEYLRRFPPVNGIPLGTSVWGFPFDAEFRAVTRAMLMRQTDASLERLRRQALKRYWLFLEWILGFPLPCFGVLAILINLGLAR